ncbi:MAG: hypothetical protein V8S08_06720 [Lachnoclostridium sp.]
MYRLHAYPFCRKTWIRRTSKKTPSNGLENYGGNVPLYLLGQQGLLATISPWVKDKFTDSPVIVMDEKGQYVIPLLSGHVGGAVETARKIASCTGGVAVITTATDVQGRFAVDVFAKKNNLIITDRVLAKKISAAVLGGESRILQRISGRIVFSR